ncbi:Hypothetical predicted protein [Paramuricea clavata]|uniref:Uncharacterized protein n=1 Tax=Paramuricea clavata TaxID=317549 RepID=A0A7D9DHT9_PARCT|nr:Hypothetical predicted protein [Paramuricea clavata]
MTQVISQNGDGSRTYTFASQPRPVKQRTKYRDPEAYENEDPLPYGNIMYDRRIIRGNTYAQHTLPASAQPDPIDIQRQQEARRRAIARKRAKKQLIPKSPEPVEGRKHIDVQTELYLEELSDRVEEADVETQTDAFLDRPPSPLYIPAKTGIDVATQILEGELFDFDIEVKPILEVLVGKTIEQALLEVMEEEELANLRAQQRRFEELRNAELVETQRLEEQERRHREEKERRMKQQTDVLKKEKETAEKIAARAFAQSYLADMVPSVFGSLSENGYFYDPVERDVETYFMPWLQGQVERNLNRYRVACLMLDSMIRNVVKQRIDSYDQLEQQLLEAIQREDAATAAVEEKLSKDEVTSATEVGQGDSEDVVETEDKPEATGEDETKTQDEDTAEQPEEDSAEQPETIAEESEVTDQIDEQ